MERVSEEWGRERNREREILCLYLSNWEKKEFCSLGKWYLLHLRSRRAKLEFISYRFRNWKQMGGNERKDFGKKSLFPSIASQFPTLSNRESSFHFQYIPPSHSLWLYKRFYLFLWWPKNFDFIFIEFWSRILIFFWKNISQ